METNPMSQPSTAGIDSKVEAAPPAAPTRPATVAQTTPVQSVLVVLGAIAFLYFARPVVLPVVLACIAGMTLKPLIRWLSCWHIPPALSAALVLVLLSAAIGIGFFKLGRPALTWMNEAPQHMTELRRRVQKTFPRLDHFSQAAAAVKDLGASEEEKKEAQKTAPTVEIKNNPGTSSILDWTGSLLVGAGEPVVLVYLLLAAGDLFLQKLVNVMPTMRDKKRAIEINREIQQNISHYLLSVSLINVGLGIAVGGGGFTSWECPTPRCGGCSWRC